jgi:hypothetical protein
MSFSALTPVERLKQKLRDPATSEPARIVAPSRIVLAARAALECLVPTQSTLAVTMPNARGVNGRRAE